MTLRCTRDWCLKPEPAAAAFHGTHSAASFRKLGHGDRAEVPRVLANEKKSPAWRGWNSSGGLRKVGKVEGKSADNNYLTTEQGLPIRVGLFAVGWRTSWCASHLGIHGRPWRRPW